MKAIVFVHGFLLSGWVFSRLSSYMSKRGYLCYRFNYSTRGQSIDHSARQLVAWLRENELQNPCFVCHSLGGILLHHYFINYQNQYASTKVVALGSPYNGSYLAAKLAQSCWGRYLLANQVGSPLIYGVTSWPDQHRLGVIAGNKSIGIGRLFGLPNNSPNDGTVLVDETLICGRNDHIILPVTHTQLLFSINVAKQVDYYFQHGIFNHEGDFK